VKKVNLVNDRGIHICKSMLAWQKWGQGESPENSGMKGDHLIGKYYVLFDRHFKEEAAALKLQGLTEDEVQQTSPLMQEAREMLRKWEQEDQEVRALWEKMNTWVYVGFEETYRRLGIDFDQIYYESETYKLGKELVEEGLDKGVFFRKEDGSVWADLSPYGLDEKLLLRADGTSVYMTQDLGTAQLRHDDYDADELVYVVGNEQNYHFEVLPRLLEMLGRPWSKAIRHFSYGMVELPQGKMKSREGTVVDADELMDEMIATARNMAQEHGKLEGLSEEEADLLFGMIGLGALKYFILKVDPKKKMMFNPEESVDFNGNTGPFIQYTHARIQSLRRKADASGMTGKVQIHLEIGEKERSLIKLLMQYPDTLSEAGQAYSPALIANYLFDLAREFNQFYHEHPVLAEENKALASFRLALSNSVGAIIKEGMHILGISVPDKM
jgi:arginyl-tRNA synthetase